MKYYMIEGKSLAKIFRTTEFKAQQNLLIDAHFCVSFQQLEKLIREKYTSSMHEQVHFSSFRWHRKHTHTHTLVGLAHTILHIKFTLFLHRDCFDGGIFQLHD